MDFSLRNRTKRFEKYMLNGIVTMINFTSNPYAFACLFRTRIVQHKLVRLELLTNM